MFNSTTLEVAIGMVLIYMIVSLFCTAVNEAIAGMLNTRARNLEKGIRSLFTEGNLQEAVKVGTEIKSQAVTLTDAIYNHGLVQSLYRCSGIDEGSSAKELKKPPSYIPSRTFASALYDILFSGVSAATARADAATQASQGLVANPGALPKGTPDLNLMDETEARLKGMLDALNKLPDGAAKQAMLTLIKEANGDAVRTRQAFERWYDDGMDRAAGWYKRNTQMKLFYIGLAMAVVLNVDSINLGRALWTTPALRAYAVSAAEQYAKNHGTPKQTNDGVNASAGDTPTATTDESKAAETGASKGATASSPTIQPAPNPGEDLKFLDSLNLPIGWSKLSTPWWFMSSSTWPFWRGLLLALFGWILTGVAVTLGAPFWFDTLNQIMVVRSTIKPREKSEVEPSKDPKKK